MSLEIFLKQNQLTKKNWDKITLNFGINSELEINNKYMNKDFFILEHENKQYIPKVNLQKTKHLEYELEIINFLDKNDILVSKPLKTINKEKFFKIGNKKVIFYEKIEGEHYNNSDTQLKEITKTLANFHKVGKKFKKKEKTFFSQTNNDNLKHLKNSSNKIVEKALRRVKDKEIPYSKLDKSLVHGDAHPGNIVFNKKGKPVFFDLEVSCIDHTAQDLAWTLRTFTSVKNWQKTGKFDLERFEIGKKYYSKYYKTDIEYIPELLLNHYLEGINRNIKNNNQKSIKENLIQTKWILENL